MFCAFIPNSPKQQDSPVLQNKFPTLYTTFPADGALPTGAEAILAEGLITFIHEKSNLT